jgi:2',3'-cyclic-nucleotide 2'-phosphodiesterase (5'-nucleotidase family)
MHLTILHTNDIHGRLEEMTRLATLIQWEKASLPDGAHVLLLDAGDSSERTIWESDVTKGRANFALLEAMGYQATTVGNSEALQWGRAALARLVQAVHLPVLAANLRGVQSGELAVPGLQTHTWFEFDGVKVAVLGATAPMAGGYERFGFTAADPEPILRDLIAEVRAEGAKLVILLSHLGYVPDEERYNPNFKGDYQLAPRLPGLDVIVGGHTHWVLEEPVEVGGVVIVQAGEFGHYLGRLDLVVDEDSGRVTEFKGHLIPATAETPTEPTIAAVLDLVREEATRLLDRVVGQAALPLPAATDAEAPLTNLVADALREICQADLAIYFSGFVAAGLSAGPITRRALYEALPGSSHVSAADVSGAQIRRMLEKMLLPENVRQKADVLRSQRPLGLPAVSRGVQVTYDPDAAPGARLVDVHLDGEPLDAARTYRLASTYYTLNDLGDVPDYGYVILEPGQALDLVRVEDVLWEIVEDWVAAHPPLRAEVEGRLVAR